DVVDGGGNGRRRGGRGHGAILAGPVIPNEGKDSWRLRVLRSARDDAIGGAQRASAAATARAAITLIIAARYSAEPCRSPLMSAVGIFTAFAASGVKLFASAFSISVARKAWLFAPVTPTRTPLAVCATQTPISAKRDAGCLNLTYAAFCSAGNATAVISSPGCSAVSHKPVKKSSAAIVRRSVWIVALNASTPAG